MSRDGVAKIAGHGDCAVGGEPGERQSRTNGTRESRPGVTRAFSGGRGCEYEIAVAATCEIRSFGAYRIYLRELSFESGDERGFERHSDPGNRDMQNLSRAGAESCGVAVFRMPYVSRLGEAERREAIVRASRASCRDVVSARKGGRFGLVRGLR